MTYLLPDLTPLALVSVALPLSVLGTACSSSSDNDGTIASDSGAEAGPQMVQLADYCTAPEVDSTDPAYVFFDLPAHAPFDELRSESDSLEDLSVLTRIGSLASENQAVPASRLFCDYESAIANDCSESTVPRLTVRDVLVIGSTLSFSVDTDDGQSTDYVIGNRDYSTTSISSMTRNGSVFTLDTARDSGNVERMQINRSGRTTTITENPDCSGTLSSSDGMSSTLTAEWTAPAEPALSLIYELCVTGDAEDPECATGSLTRQ